MFASKILLKITAIITALLSAVILCACNNVDTSYDDVSIPKIEPSIFSVHFLNVGQGDSIFINFPDGKIMLIDCGSEDEDTAKLINGCIKASGKDKIDYLVLTHPDEDHVGNVKSICEEYYIGTAFLPKVDDLAKFPSYETAYNFIEDKSDKIEISEIGKCYLGEDYFFSFLWPKPYLLGGYDPINLEEGTSSQVNNISAVIYLEYLEKKFLFTGDVDKTVMDDIIEYHKVGMYNNNAEKKEIDLVSVDFLKVSHHGSLDGLNRKFLSIVNPLNAIISVGAENKYNHPSTEVLTALTDINPNVNIYRTDVNGTISISIDNNGTVKAP